MNGTRKKKEKSENPCYLLLYYSENIQRPAKMNLCNSHVHGKQLYIRVFVSILIMIIIALTILHLVETQPYINFRNIVHVTSYYQLL